MSDVVLVSMPFGPAFAPSIGLSLLKAGLAREGIDASLHYCTIRFAEAVGQAFYSGVANGSRPTLQDLAGEWLFSGALSDATAADDERYVETLLRGYYPDALIGQLLRARARVDGFLDDCLAVILREEPKVVGFTSVFQQHAASLALARRIKRLRPSTFVVLGGANCEGVMGAETVRSFPFVDAAVSGEADLVFPELVTRVLNGASVSPLPGVRSRESVTESFATGLFGNAPMVTNMDDLPRPDYSDYFQQFRASRYDRDWRPTLFLETARGCWWGERMHCTFCGLNGATMAFRSKSAARALAEVTELAERYPGCEIQTVDNILDLRYFKDLIPALAARRSKAKLFWETKSNLSKTQVRLLRDAGIREIQPGVESLSDAVLTLMRKGVTGLQNIQILKWCKEFGIDARWNFLWGFPGEPPDEYARLAQVIPSLTHLQPPIGASSIRLDRFSPNFFDAERLGFTSVRPVAAYSHVYRLPDAAITNLACYFTYEYGDARDVAAYTGPVVRQIAKWKRLQARADVLSIEAGDYLVLLDLRPGAGEPFVLLDGIAKILYDECDAARGLWELTQRVAAVAGAEPPRATVERLLAPLVERRLLLREGSRFLALAIPIGDYVPPPAVSREFSRIVRRAGTRCGEQWIVQAVHVGGCGREACFVQPEPTQTRARRRAGGSPPHLTACSFSVESRGRLVIQRSGRSRQRRRRR